MNNVDDKINEMSENIVLKNKDLFSYYMENLNHYNHLTMQWENCDDTIKLVKLFESIVSSKNKMYRFISIAMENLDAFNQLIKLSEILKNDEELIEYLNIIHKMKEKIMAQNVMLNSKLEEVKDEINKLKFDLVRKGIMVL